MNSSVRVVTKKYSVGKININVAVCGRGRPIVLVHGWSNNWSGWIPLARELASTYTVHMIDLPGFGDSDRLSSYSLDIEADFVVRFVREYIGKSEAIIGASMGTLVATKALQMYPKITNKLILLGAMFQQLSIRQTAGLYIKFLQTIRGHETLENIFVEIVKAPVTAYMVEKYLHAYSFNKKSIDSYMIPGRKKVTGKSYVELGMSAATFVLEHALSSLTHPTLLIYGEAERYVRPDDARRIISNLNKNNIALAVIPRAGHSPSYEQPQITAQHLFDFLGN